MRLPLTRRRVIGISAAAAGLSLLPLGRSVRADAHVVTWRGTALGASATLRIHHPDRAVAERLVQRTIAEARRLEQVFSLYRDDSALVRLNRDGVLIAPPADLVTLLGASRRLWQLSSGAFDPSVQPLWSAYREHFSRAGHDPAGPPAETVRAALDRVGFEHVTFDTNRVVLGRRGMALTLNGIAQGYVTDRVVEILRAGGVTSSLVDMGESRAIGSRPDGTAWQFGIADPDAPDKIRSTIGVIDRAVATSGGYGFQFDAEGRFNHLLDPRSGGSAGLYQSVSVVARDATLADGCSTAFSLLPPETVQSLADTVGECEIYLGTSRGDRMIIKSKRT